MKKNLSIVAVSVVLLAACAGPQIIYTDQNPRLRGYSLLTASPPNATAPNIFIVGGEIVVDQEPIRPVPGDQVTIYFALADQDPNYTFQPKGIEIHQQPNACAPQNDWVFKCSYRRPTTGTVYKYAIRVKTPHGTVHDLDPTIMN